MTQAQKERFIALAVGAAGVLLIAAGWIISPRRKKLREKRRAGRANRD